MDKLDWNRPIPTGDPVKDALMQKRYREMTHFQNEPLPPEVEALGNYIDKVKSGGFLKEHSDRFGEISNAPDLASAAGKAQNLEDYFGPAPMGLLGMTLYHGSPHKFDKFSLDHIGKGEGAQAYGHGLYFAEDPKVAHSYRKQLSELDKDLTENVGKQLERMNYGITKSSGDVNVDKIAKRAFDDGFRYDPKSSSSYNELIDNYIDRGNLYEVDIPDEYVNNFLDWDKPLSEQPEVFELVKKSEFYNNYLDRLIKHAGGADKFAGGSAYKALEKIEDAPVVSQMFNKAGIKGIKYFDGSSRAAGEGTRNLVVFDDSIVKTLKRNDEAIEELPEMLKRQSGDGRTVEELDAVSEEIPYMLKRQSD